MQAKRDENYIPTLLAVSSVDQSTPVTLFADPTTHRLYVDIPGTSGDVIGPATNTDSYIPQWDGADSKKLKNGLAVPAGGLAGITALNTKQQLLTTTSIKTTDYSAQPFELIPVSLAVGNVKITLPSAPADETVIWVKLNTVAANRYVTLATSGTDKFNTATGNVEIYMYLFGEYAQMQYEASTGLWNTFISAGTYNWANNNPGVDASTPITNANISINTTSRVLTITPPLGYFNIFSDGGGIITRYRKVGTITFPAFTNTSGLWYFYFDSTGTPVTTQTAWTVDNFPTICPVYRLLWNATLYNFTVTAANVNEGDTYTNNGQTFTIRQTYTGATTIKTSGTGDPATSGTLTRATGTGDATITFSAFSIAPRLVSQYIEYHVNDIPADVHQWFHLQGTQWMNGFTMANNALVSGAPNADGRNTVIALTTGSNVDDNLEYTVTNNTTGNPFTQDLGNTTPASLNATNSALFTIFRQSSTGTITFRDATRFPFDWNVVTNIPNYITSLGVRTPVTNQRFMVNFIYAVQNPVAGEAIKVVSATQDFTSLTNARAYNWADIQNTYSVLNEGEVRVLYRLIHEVHTGAPAAYDAGAKYSVLRETQDLRKTQVTSTTVATGSIPASSVTVVPAGTLSSTNAQAALDELDTEKLAITGGTMTGNLLFTDNTLDIGANGATRPRTGYFGTSINSPLVNGLTITNNGTNTLNITAGKTLTVQDNVTITGALGTGAYATIANYLPLAGGTMTGKMVSAGRSEVAKTYTPATGSQTVALDCSVNNMHVITGHADGTAITFTVTGATDSQPFIVMIKQGSGTVSTIVSWFSGISWCGGSAPTLTATLSKTDTFGFIRTGSNTYTGYIIGQNA